ncbi:hypothetical protein HDU78_011735 [Chytriomyces hyalinus]|nr:hypothetical protein HDU78_011735 [Chytriomyces hyalinus]
MDPPLKFEPILVKKGGVNTTASLSLTRHHLVLVFSDGSQHWLIYAKTSYSALHSIDRHFQTPDGLFPLIINGRNFSSIKLTLSSEAEVTDIFSNLRMLMNISSIDNLLAFHYQPVSQFSVSKGWSIYDPEVEFRRMGLGVKSDAWRISSVNKDFAFCPTYPKYFAVPSRISDNVLKHAVKFRSKGRIPVLSYIHRTNQVTITRCAQPLVGLQQNRSIQDEKLTESIFTTGRVPPVQGQSHLIIDARPAANVMGQTAMGAGIESTENYRNCKICLLGIGNIHVMRDSMNKLMEAAHSGDTGQFLRAGLDRSGWLGHIRTVLDGTLMVVKNVHSYNTHALVHCSDGWDRTAQICSLAEMCLDPYYRTIEGFQVLIEKEWMSFGHKFRDRLGLLSKPKRDGNSGPSVGSQISAASKSMQFSLTSAAKSLLKQSPSALSSSGGRNPNGSPSAVYRTNGSGTHVSGPQGSLEIATPSYLASHEVSPIFTQFLDCVYQLWTQFPTQFEFSEKYLLTLNSHLYSCQFGTFVFNNEKERVSFMVKGQGSPIPSGKASYSLWDYFLSNKSEYLNPLYMSPEQRKEMMVPSPEAMTDGDVLLPSPENARYWMGLYLCTQKQPEPDAIFSFSDASNDPVGEIKPLTASAVGAMGASAKSGVQYTVGDLDDEQESTSNGGGASNGSPATSSWQAAFSSTASQVSSFANIATTSWSMGGGWIGSTSGGSSGGNSNYAPVDPLLSMPQANSNSPSSNAKVAVAEAPKQKISSPVSSSPRLSLQERLAKTVERQMSDMDLKKSAVAVSNAAVSVNGSSSSSLAQTTATIDVEAEDAGAPRPSQAARSENVPHPLWSAE